MKTKFSSSWWWTPTCGLDASGVVRPWTRVADVKEAQQKRLWTRVASVEEAWVVDKSNQSEGGRFMRAVDQNGSGEGGPLRHTSLSTRSSFRLNAEEHH